MKNQITIKDITYDIIAEVSLMEYSNIQAACAGYYVSNLLLRRPKGTKEFGAMRDKFNNVTLN